MVQFHCPRSPVSGHLPGLPGKIRPGGFEAQKQGRASRLFPQSPGRDPDLGRLRAEAGGQRQRHRADDGGCVAPAFQQ
jgi:hypothetical protein